MSRHERTILESGAAAPRERTAISGRAGNKRDRARIFNDEINKIYCRI